ncbi:MAG TPA: 2-C-methyl-D-erythritol 2,4-cyclodiphosphate synthase [Treponemataceae bacterium]|nr:2-C-methyl-D-erythritol 2,4-cyclodiphosphate synthase [Treponemataceae bacterium]
MTVALILTAAGSSTRLGIGKKKEFIPMQSLVFPKTKGTVLSCAAESFLQAFPYVFNSKTIKLSHIILTAPSEQKDLTLKALQASPKVIQAIKKNNICLTIINGGKTRQKSIFAGLKTLDNASCIETKEPDFVFIHDAARPFVDTQTIQAVIRSVILYEAAVPAIQPTDTQKEIDKNGKIKRHLQRNLIAAVQTPQAFAYKKLFKAHIKAATDLNTYTDDSEIWGTYCGDVYTCKGNADNVKITYEKDLNILQTEKINEEPTSMIRVGLGYDVHRLIKNRRLILGGIEIPSKKGTMAHSDGDALLHAITDSLLGAAALSDIGELFPPSEAKWRNADSAEFLKTAWELVQKNGWKLENLDCVIALQKPKLLLYRDKIRHRIAEILCVKKESVFIKAKTGEKLDSVGKCKAIEVWASCLLRK